MSNEYINGVIVHSQSKRSARAVLMAIANRVGDDGICWLSHATIAAEAGISERTVTRAILQLAEAGEIAVLSESHQHYSPQYRILLQPEKRAQSRQNVYAGKPQSRQIDARVDNLSSRVDKLSEPTYTRELEPKQQPIEEPRESAPAQPATPPARKIVTHKSPYLNAAHFVNGYIPAGQGANAVEVYYERFDIRQDAARLNVPNEDDLVRLCPDLVKLRAVITEYSQMQGYRPGNVALILDWYRDGPPSQRRRAAPLPGAVGARPVSRIDASMAAIDRVEKMLIDQGVFQ